MGFMNHDPAITANLGLWDLVTALQWIQDYIHHFGGNRNKVNKLFPKMFFYLTFFIAL